MRFLEPRKKHHMEKRWRIVLGLSMILDGLVNVLTLGFIGGNFAIRFCLFNLRAKLILPTKESDNVES